MVTKLWKDQKYRQEGDCQRRFIWKLKDLKVITKIWAKDKKAQDTTVLENLEENIKMLLQRIAGGNHSREVEANLIILETERNKFLKE
jgi:hypothetical protein